MTEEEVASTERVLSVLDAEIAAGTGMACVWESQRSILRALLNGDGFDDEDID
jgi:hypothetical protein